LNIAKYLPVIILSLNSVLFFCVFPPAVRAEVVSEQQAAQETEIQNLRLLEPAYGISFGYVEADAVPGGGKYLCGGMNVNSARSAAGVVRSAFAKMPSPALAKAQLKYIILCSRAEVSGQAIGGIPVPPLNLLMVAVSGNPVQGEHLVIHELYHLLEFRFNTFNDANWQNRFSTGYANSYTGRIAQSAIGSGGKGFLNSYSETFPHEDRAELFASLLLEAPKVANQINAANDTMLREKVLYLVDKWNPLLGMALPFPR
jgi:hypothetical protein